MNLSLEQKQAYRDNGSYQTELRQTLIQAVKPFETLRTLDYGAGVSPDISLFHGLHPSEEVICFDPEVDLDAGHLHPIVRDIILKSWVTKPPEGQFDLVVCHFSIHHMGRNPKDVVDSLRNFNPKLVTIAEYDYTKATREEFERTFIADAEKGELDNLFGGDMAACFDFHSKFRETDFSQALTSQGFRVAHRGVGQGYAAYKLFLVGEVVNFSPSVPRPWFLGFRGWRG